MKRYLYFFLSGLNGLPDPFANIGFVEEVKESELKGNSKFSTTAKFEKLCKLNNVTNRDLYRLNCLGMEF